MGDFIHDLGGPVRLTELDSQAILQHLLALNDEDRCLRFSRVIRDIALREYVAHIDFNRDVVLGVWGAFGLAGLCHLAVFDERGHPVAELGVSVDRRVRGRGLSSRMLAASLEESRKRGISTVYVMFMRRNFRMASLVSRAGATLAADDDECTASIQVVERQASSQVRVYHLDSGLEVLEKRAGHAGATPVVLVHGAGGCCWQWRIKFVPYLAAKGYDVHAVSLTNHGRSRRLSAVESVLTYVNDVEEVTRSLEAVPIIVGHSMGGFVVQHWLSRNDARKAVLMGAVPHNKLSSEELKQAQDNLFSYRSKEVLAQALAVSPAVRPADIRVPVTVLGGARDKVIPLDLVRRTAAAYGAELLELPNSGHGMMLGPDWQRAADAI